MASHEDHKEGGAPTKGAGDLRKTMVPTSINGLPIGRATTHPSGDYIAYHPANATGGSSHFPHLTVRADSAHVSDLVVDIDGAKGTQQYHAFAGGTPDNQRRKIIKDAGVSSVYKGPPLSPTTLSNRSARFAVSFDPLPEVPSAAASSPALIGPLVQPQALGGGHGGVAIPLAPPLGVVAPVTRSDSAAAVFEKI